MRWRGRWVVASLTLVGCSRDNPDFGGTEVAAQTEGDTTEGSTSVDADTGPPPMTTGGPGPGDTTSETGPIACDPFVPEPYEITAQLTCPDMPDEICLEVGSQPGEGGTSIDAFICHDCTCAMVFADKLTPDFGIELPAMLPPYIQVNRVPAPQQSGLGCDLVAYTILDQADGTPLAAAANRLFPADGVGLDLTFGRALEPCGEELGCVPRSPGVYELYSPLQDTEIPEGDDVEIGNFQVFNDFSRVDGDCEEVVRWHAVRNP